MKVEAIIDKQTDMLRKVAKDHNPLTNSSWSEVGTSRYLTLEESDIDESRAIYVRPCYVEIFQILCDMWTGNKRCIEHKSAALITGTPGIGKSLGGLVFCQMALSRPKPALVLYRARFMSPKIVRLLWQGRQWLIPEMYCDYIFYALLEDGLISQKSHEDDKIEIWSIGDTCIPSMSDSACNLICITSPGQSDSQTSFGCDLKEWKKGFYPKTLTAPPCNWEELLAIRACHYNFDEKKADEKCPLE